MYQMHVNDSKKKKNKLKLFLKVLKKNFKIKL